MITKGVIFEVDLRYDVIVIGAGNGGLMTSLRAARMGLKTLVIERNNLPGGAASSFVRGRFEFEAALHEIPDFGEGDLRGELGLLFDELGVKVDMRPIKDSFRYIVEKNGVRSLDITFPHGKENIERLIGQECPEDKEAMEKFFMAAKDLQKGLEYVGKCRGVVDPDIMAQHYPNFARIFSMTAGDFFRAIGMSDKCIDIMTAYWPYQGADINTIDASRYIMMVSGYFLKGAYCPSMRSHELSVAIMRRACQLGVRFLFDTEVTKVLTKDGRVCGVETSTGQTFESVAVVSNTFPEIVYSKLIDNKDLVPKSEFKKINARKYGFRAFCVYLGLDASPEELGIKDYTIFISTTKDSKVIYDSSNKLDMDDMALDVCCLNIAVPECSPEGTTELVLTISYTDDAWADIKPEDYVAAKRRVADKMISYFEEVMKIDIRSHIEEIEIASPVTFARYMGTPQGSIYGYLSDRWDGMSARMMASRSEPTVPGLFFVGGHSQGLSGFFPTYTTGNRTGMMVYGYIMGGGR